jgi:hypothetical protein
MDAISGFAAKIFMKQKMGNIADSLPQADKKKPAAGPTAKEMRRDIQVGRAERDAELEQKKAGQKKLSMSDRWAQNKAANS